MATVFFSYSHRDEVMRDELEMHLSALKRQGLIESWHDRRILVGDEWAREIDRNLNDADIILLLISPYFIASDYCYELEMRRAIERHEEGEARVIPVIIEPCDWQNTPFSKLQAVPTNGTPISKFSNQHEGFLEVVTAIKKAVIAKGNVPLRDHRGVEHCQEDLGKEINLDLVLIPGGSFMMGSPDGQGKDNERPQHEVTVKSFLMGKYVVTQAQWKAVATLPEVNRVLTADPSRYKGDNRPVECVTWDDAVEFCKRLSKKTGREYRLPSEAEWEYACRAGTKTSFYFGESLTLDLPNYDTGPTADVGSFPANAFGLYDMHGNVWEWCLDHWHENYEGAPTDGSAWLSSDSNKSRLLRGGFVLIEPDNCCSALRYRYMRDVKNDGFGFRVVCDSSWAL
ncbi:MAG: SUMF1/EgtB/PvdO family nonheme iron enzyme [Cyanobacteria bacterium P01_D01_bin.156]